jgi:two-component system LytT family response regulator
MHRLVSHRLEIPKAGQSVMIQGPSQPGRQDQSLSAESLIQDWSASFSVAEGTSASGLEVPDRNRGAGMDAIDTIIVDDEPLARQKLAFLLKKDPAFRIVAQCASAGEAINALTTHRPALMFLDIQMPDDNGFAVVNSIDPDHRPKIIFTTAYDQFAMQAFEAQAIDYLLKPFDEERFARAVKRAKDEIVAEAVHRSPSNGHKKLERFIVKSEGRILFFTTEEIDWIEAASNYVRLYSNGKGYLVRHTMNDLERKLDPAHFLRIHRSIIVNIHKIRGIQPCNSGEFIVSLISGKELPSSRGYRQNLGSLLK